MPKNIIENLFEYHIERFKTAFLSTSRELFYDDDRGRLRHPGEFGTHRERIVHNFLKLFVPSHLEMGNGFIANSYGTVSTQCDLIIYDPSATPLIEDAENQRFFPCESVLGIGEVKSKVSKSQLKAALKKLASVKEMRRHIKAPAFRHPSHRQGDSYDPSKHPQDTPITFLICEGIDAPIDEMPDVLESAYSELDHPLLKHNLVLNVTEATYHYYDRKTQDHVWYPWINGNEFEPSLSIDDFNNAHFKVFCSYLNNGLIGTAVLNPELHTYLEHIQPKVFNKFND